MEEETNDATPAALGLREKIIAPLKVILKWTFGVLVTVGLGWLFLTLGNLVWILLVSLWLLFCIVVGLVVAIFAGFEVGAGVTFFLLIGGIVLSLILGLFGAVGEIVEQIQSDQKKRKKKTEK